MRKLNGKPVSVELLGDEAAAQLWLPFAENYLRRVAKSRRGPFSACPRLEGSDVFIRVRFNGSRYTLFIRAEADTSGVLASPRTTDHPGGFLPNPFYLLSTRTDPATGLKVPRLAKRGVKRKCGSISILCPVGNDLVAVSWNGLMGVQADGTFGRGVRLGGPAFDVGDAYKVYVSGYEISTSAPVYAARLVRGDYGGVIETRLYVVWGGAYGIDFEVKYCKLDLKKPIKSTQTWFNKGGFRATDTAHLTNGLFHPNYNGPPLYLLGVYSNMVFNNDATEIAFLLYGDKGAPVLGGDSSVLAALHIGNIDRGTDDEEYPYRHRVDYYHMDIPPQKYLGVVSLVGGLSYTFTRLDADTGTTRLATYDHEWVHTDATALSAETPVMVYYDQNNVRRFVTKTTVSAYNFSDNTGYETCEYTLSSVSWLHFGEGRSVQITDYQLSYSSIFGDDFVKGWPDGVLGIAYATHDGISYDRSDSPYRTPFPVWRPRSKRRKIALCDPVAGLVAWTKTDFDPAIGDYAAPGVFEVLDINPVTGVCAIGMDDQATASSAPSARFNNWHPWRVSGVRDPRTESTNPATGERIPGSGLAALTAIGQSYWVWDSHSWRTVLFSDSFPGIGFPLLFPFAPLTSGSGGWPVNLYHGIEFVHSWSASEPAGDDIDHVYIESEFADAWESDKMAVWGKPASFFYATRSGPEVFKLDKLPQPEEFAYCGAVGMV